MVIIRESPLKARPSPAKTAVQWPPASPFQALISSPSGRRKWQDIQEQRYDASPSPSRKLFAQTTTAPSEHDSMSSDDEESLKLKLEILETKRKLRELKKRRRDQSPGKNEERTQQTDAINGRLSPQKRRKLLEPRTENGYDNVEVPLSPVRSSRAAVLPASPAKIRLGLDRATKAEEVSLKRPKNASQLSSAHSALQKLGVDRNESKPRSSFGDRLHKARETQQNQIDRSERLESIRSKTFGSVRNKQSATADIRDTRNSGSNQARSARVQQTRSIRPISPRQQSKSTRDTTVDSNVVKHTTNEDSSLYESFSSTHLSKRHMPHAEVARSLSGVEIYTLPRLLKEVTAPAYDTPECESDYVVFGILASKSSPFEQKATHRKVTTDSDGTKEAPRSKFMVLRLCDLNWEIDCYLFGSGFDKFWKLTEGTLLAILNPGILPPKANVNNGKFSLKLANCEETVLEIGIARDLGYCSAKKRDGVACNTWVNKAKTSICEFHLSMEISRSRQGRMEVNSMWRGEGDGKKPGQKTGQKSKRNNVKYHPEYGHLWHYDGTAGKSAASLLDSTDIDKLHNLTDEELSRKRIAAAQRERDVAKKLSQVKAGVAGDYFRAAQGISLESEQTVEEQKMFKKPTASELGLLSRNANDQRLSPAKDRRRHFGIGAVSSAGTEALGWSGARKPDLLQPKQNRLTSPERGQSRLDLLREKSQLHNAAQSPSKKTRFALSKGIREPGRESGGHDFMNDDRSSHKDDENVDNDDLEIV